MTPATPLTVRPVDPDRDPRWDAYVREHPDSTVFHRTAWLRVLRHEYGDAPLALAAEDAGGRLRGVLPLLATRGLPLVGSSAGRRLSSLPRTPVAGPVADDDAAAAALIAEAMRRTPPGAQLQIKVGGPTLDGLVPGLVGHAWRLNYTVALPDSPEKIRFGRSRDNNRRQAAYRRARESGLAVRSAETLDDVRRWYRLYLETMRHHIVPPRRWRLFAALWEELRPAGMLDLLLAVRGDDLVAGNLLVTDGRTAHYLFNGTPRARLDEGANEMLQYDAIHRLCASGHRHYDLGEVVEGHIGLARFKRKWGAEETRLHRYYAPAPAEPPDPGDGEPGRLTDTLHRAWRRVPLPATALAGTAVYRFL